ncbi:PadR family transcriptional regulator [Candidatus Saccharibacteria bacterium]|nr:PadR family transcriptional regulator [Candidatus Saccharibacteria bacterium]
MHYNDAMAEDENQDGQEARGVWVGAGGSAEARKGAVDYAAELTVQLKKGTLTQCVLLATSEPVYASEILLRLGEAELEIVEGTIYPLLSRLARDGLLMHEWQESRSGPPRKYYRITEYGRAVRECLGGQIHKMDSVIKKLERKAK